MKKQQKQKYNHEKSEAQLNHEERERTHWFRKHFKTVVRNNKRPLGLLK